MPNQSEDSVAKTHEVVIAGGGPTGLMLAGELALARIDVAIMERRASQDVSGMRAGGLHMRTLEVLDQRGIAERFISQGQVFLGGVPFARILLETADAPTRHNYFLALWQYRIEQILADWVAELSVPIYRGLEVTSFDQAESNVDVQLSDGRALRARYLVGCDGGRSVIRKQAGIDFPGWEPSTSYLIAEVELAEEPEWGFRRNPKGMSAIGKLEDGKRARVVLNEPYFGRGNEATLEDVRTALIAVYGKDFGLRSASYVSRFTDMARQAAQYRERRVLVAGDAAHVHSPVGGQGLNIGVQDAMNLGWKLAEVVRGTSPESLLDTYHAERHPVGARVLRNTLAITALDRSDDRIEALRELMTEQLQAPATRRQYVAMMSGLDIHYDLGEGHPLLGRRMPDLDLTIANSQTRVFELLHDARAVLLSFGAAFDVAPWGDRVKRVDAQPVAAWELPALGPVAAPKAVLIRPDGYVAWTSADGTDAGLYEALTKWFGPRTAG